MKNAFLFFSFILLFFSDLCLAQNAVQIADMRWEQGFGVSLQLSNDSNYVFKVEELYHANSKLISDVNKIIYYPVGFGEQFVEQLKGRELKDIVIVDKDKPKSVTLWSAVHYSIGGGYVHFVNCLLYALETGNLRINAPLLERPESRWKPKPVTETYLRTKKWKYYIPEKQKYAIKEYKIKAKKGELKDLQTIPQEFINSFLNTTEKQYLKMSENYQIREKAKIDLMHILVASNYLNTVSIDYIKNAVLSTVIKYSQNQLPAVIIMDDFNAAIAMSLNENGYIIERIVFNDSNSITADEEAIRVEKIHAIINNINKINQQIFQRSLQNYYTK